MKRDVPKAPSRKPGTKIGTFAIAAARSMEF